MEEYLGIIKHAKIKVLKQKHENELDQVHIQVKTQDYDPISGNRKTNSQGEFITFLIKDLYDNYDGKVNEFLWSDQGKKKDLILIKGKAGSGKSRASHYTISPNWIQIYVSLPSLKDPHHNLIDQALKSENYNIDNIQIREFKDAVINVKLKIVLILESYDEMKFDCIALSNQQNGLRSQSLSIRINSKRDYYYKRRNLNSIGYQTWFYGQNIDTLKEIEILPFSYEQSSQYIKQYVEISVKRTIKKFYQFLKQLKGQNFSLEQFKLIWNQLENIINSMVLLQQNSEVLFSSQDVDTQNKFKQYSLLLLQNQIRWYLQKRNFFNCGESKNSLSNQQCEYKSFIDNSIYDGIIVYVLPNISQFFSKPNLIRDLLKRII
ncbi:unnamed protein product [Paramecium pentaurelia]|uniref:Uncharacterized protein n=1 Tax=Paramecium pentaurelia TaxID=43138 RepID=A0A8S1XQT4_9CILI|nr:unnamed protein product [Paramecium pentaurelia]